MLEVRMTVNGSVRSSAVPQESTLLETLRNEWGLTGVKTGCDAGDCGACTVLVDGLAVNACLMLTAQADGREVVTVEGLSDVASVHPLQAAFERLASFQCGFCAPGMVVAAKALLDREPAPSEHRIREALAGNLCRCTGYTKIVEAIVEICGDGGSGGGAAP